MDDKKLIPWVVPRWAVTGFCQTVWGDMYVTQILEHNSENYLVITRGFDAFQITELENYLTNLWEAPAIYEEYEANVKTA